MHTAHRAPASALRAFLATPPFAMLVFVLAMTVHLGADRVMVMKLLAMLIAVVLVICDDLLPSIMPFMAIMAIGASYTGDFSSLPQYWPFAIPAIAAYGYHLIRYRKPFRPGRSLPGLVAVSLAVLLGGAGCIPQEEYFSSTSLLYMALFALGLPLFYILMSSQLHARTGDTRRALLFVFLLTGILCALFFLLPLLRNLGTLRQVKGYAYKAYMPRCIPYRNGMSTLLIMMLPAPFFFASDIQAPAGERVAAFLCGMLLYAGLLVAMARTALLFGTVLFALCLVYYAYGRHGWQVKACCLVMLAAAAAVLLIFFRQDLAVLLSVRLRNGLIHADESRVALLRRAWEDFTAHPFFGVGLGAMKNADIYPPPRGCICWYHMYFPQIFGSMGLFGLLCFGLQLFQRVRMALYRPDRAKTALFLCYVGLFLYSQTDPGEFEPIPYAFLAVLIFLLLENGVSSPLCTVKHK